MDEQIEVSLDRIKEIISAFDISSNFSTTDVIEKYSGIFVSNIKTPAFYSFNAQFGKLLKRNEIALEISEIQKEYPITDGIGHKTKTSLWRRNT